MKIYNPTGFSTNLTGSFSGSVKGTLTATGNIIPDVSGAYDIGSTEFPFKDLYITQNSLKFIDDSTGNEIGRISVNSNTGDIKLLNTKNLTEEQKATLTAENVGAEALSPVSASSLWVSQSIFAGHENTNIGHTAAPFHTLHTQFISASSTNITGDLKVGGTVTAQEFHTEFVSASIVYESGSTQFGNSGDDTHVFTGSLNVSGSITGTLATAAQPNITSLGTLSSLGVSGNLSVDTNVLFVDTANDRVGIGTSSPEAILNVRGSNSPHGSTGIPSVPTLQLLRNTDDSGNYAGLVIKTVAAGSDFGLYSNQSGALFYHGGTERMRITSGGSVLIGTSTLASVTSDFDALTIGKTGSANSSIVFTDGSNTRWGFVYGNSSKIAYSSFNNVTFESGATATERMRITSTGNVGIGTTAPGHVLHTYGTSGWTTKVQGGNNLGAFIGHEGGYGMAIRTTQTSSEYYLLNLISGGSSADGGGGTVFYVGADGYVSVAGRMHISGNQSAGENMLLLRKQSFGTSEGATIADAAISFKADQNNYGSLIGYSYSNNAFYGGNIELGYHSSIRYGSLNRNAFHAIFEDSWSGNTQANGNPCFRIYGNGATQNLPNSYGGVSDQRFKTDITPSASQWDDIKAINVVNYKLIKDIEVYSEINEQPPRYLGVIAQQLEEAGMTGLVHEDENGVKGVKYSILYMKAIKALQEAMTKIEDLENRISQLEG